MVDGAHPTATLKELPGVRTAYDGIIIHGGKGAHHRQWTNHA